MRIHASHSAQAKHGSLGSAALWVQAARKAWVKYQHSNALMCAKLLTQNFEVRNMCGKPVRNSTSRELELNQL